MAGCRMNRRVVVVLGLVICVAVLSQLFKYGPDSTSEKQRDEKTTVTTSITVTSAVFIPRDLPQSLTLDDTVSKQQLPQVDRITKLNSDQKDDLQRICLSFYEKLKNPIFQPLPVCGSKDYSSHSVHCYQSLINFSPNLTPKSDGDDISLKHLSSRNDLAHLGVTCSIQNMAVNSRNVIQSLRDCARNCDIRSSKSLFLMQQKSKCPLPTISKLMNITDDQDDTKNFVHELLMLNSKKSFDPSECSRWVNETALFFIANEPYNAYLQFLTYYNVFVTMNLVQSTKRASFSGLNSRSNKSPMNLLVVRLSDATDYRFGAFEQKLFPRIIDLGKLSQNSKGTVDNFTCFQSVVKVPWAYSALPFQCVINSKLKSESLRCYNTAQTGATLDMQKQEIRGHTSMLGGLNSVDTRNLLNQQNSVYRSGIRNGLMRANVVPSMMLFRNEVLKACEIKENTSPYSVQSSRMQQLPLPRHTSASLALNVILIKRKPYLRHGQDSANLFERILSNEGELEAGLVRNGTKNLINIKSVYMEELEICEQVRLSHKADVIIGVHGAGLVHTWWMKSGGALLELVPVSKLNRPTYKVLAGLTGVRYYSVTLEDGLHRHHSKVNVSTVVDTLSKISKELMLTA